MSLNSDLYADRFNNEVISSIKRTVTNTQMELIAIVTKDDAQKEIFLSRSLSVTLLNKNWYEPNVKAYNKKADTVSNKESTPNSSIERCLEK